MNKSMQHTLPFLFFLSLIFAGSVFAQPRQFNVLEEGKTEKGETFYVMECKDSGVKGKIVIQSDRVIDTDVMCKKMANSEGLLLDRRLIEIMNDLCICK